MGCLNQGRPLSNPLKCIWSYFSSTNTHSDDSIVEGTHFGMPFHEKGIDWKSHSINVLCRDLSAPVAAFMLPLALAKHVTYIHSFTCHVSFRIWGGYSLLPLWYLLFTFHLAHLREEQGFVFLVWMYCLLYKPARGESRPTQCLILYMLGAIAMANRSTDKSLPLLYLCSFHQMEGNPIRPAQVGYSDDICPTASWISPTLLI